jgi:CheY-like chemotaxis protein
MVDVLVVEDDDDVAMLMEAFLEDGGHRVRIAPDGESGLARLTERFPDVVVMDVEMPLLTGPAMAARMRAENAGRESIPVVLVSGATRLPQIADEVGTPYCLGKPFAPSALLALVERAARERLAPRPTTQLAAH